MDKPVGGRGKSTPYKSTHIRIPEPLKGRVEELKELFYSNQLELHDEKLAEDNRLANEYKHKLANNNLDNSGGYIKLNNRDEILELARRILKQKKSAKLSVLKLLTGLLGDDISLEDLTE